MTNLVSEDNQQNNISNRESVVKRNSIKNFINFFPSSKSPIPNKEIDSFNYGNQVVSPLAKLGTSRISNSLLPDLDFIMSNIDSEIPTKEQQNQKELVRRDSVFSYISDDKGEIEPSTRNTTTHSIPNIEDYNRNKKQRKTIWKTLPSFCLLSDANVILNESNFLNDFEKRRFIMIVNSRPKYFEDFSRAISITKYRCKRKRRGINGRVRYRVRQEMANHRPRVQGKFVKSEKISILGMASKMLIDKNLT